MDRRVKEAIKVLKAPGVLTEEAKRELLELLVFPPERRKMTYEEFLDWADEDTLAEWVDGEVVIYSPASKRHQEIAGFLYRLLSDYVELKELGSVFQSPFQMKLERSGREPDLLFVAKENLHRLKPTYLDGPADLVVEIVSPESVVRDKGEKFYEYQEASIPEYWLIDPDQERAEFYRLGEDGLYRVAFAGREGGFRSEVLSGFWLRVEWLWQESLPPVEDVMLEIGGEEYARRLVERLKQRGFL